MADQSINISSTGFSPNPLNAAANDVVSWANRTNEKHQIAINGVLFTDEIEPFTSSSPAFVCQNDTDPAVPVIVSYTCVISGHKETGTINIAPFLLLCALMIGIF